ncbi:ABC transporter ATP-binding protein [Corynebacterium otitidis]|uniref:ABC transporter ATP-binding protein n=1 Tax=Corynebacterium otitidis TaxID=29321 RepID=UPI0006277240|nr:ABC transporter ATP-binding protein [Corynebacterium otitidis]KKO84529.1 peptide ABC transporter ATP-binding protein [Corynebacterium otitidis]
MRGIVKTFSSGAGSLTVLHGVDLAVERGEFLSVVGQSGSGKSTLMNIIGLLDRPNAGSYRLAGDDVLALRDDALAHRRSRSIGFVFQSFNLVSELDARGNVEMPMMYAGVPRGERRERAESLLERVGVGDRAAHRPDELSGGQRQRVAIARALANNPEILLADEPTGALDTATGRSVMDLFHELNLELGTTIVFITHNEELAAETTRTVTMSDGRFE